MPEIPVTPLTEVLGSVNAENIVYFKSPLSAYDLSESCTHGSCNVTKRTGTGASVALTNVDVLVFADQELRP
jgi:hypothetical protein